MPYRPAAGRTPWGRWLAVALIWLAPWSAALSQQEFGELDDTPFIDDTPRIRNVEHPDWFKISFLDLPEDLREAREAGKGLIVYFGQKHCAYCEALMKVNFGLDDIVRYTRDHFDVVAIDIWGSREVVTLQGEHLTEREYAVREQTNFTPSMLFYDQEGRLAFRMRGYLSPYKFRALLEYVVEGFHRRESFREYLARADPPPRFEDQSLNPEPFFQPPPYALDRSRIKAQRPLVVFFEQGDCHACDILHTGPLKEERARELLEGFDAVQLDMWSDTPVLTPDGRRLTAREWARELGIYFAPTLVFFDEGGEEIIRIDAVVRLYRLQGVLEYVAEKGYLKAPTYQRWRQMQRMPSVQPPEI